MKSRSIPSPLIKYVTTQRALQVLSADLNHGAERPGCGRVACNTHQKTSFQSRQTRSQQQ